MIIDSQAPTMNVGIWHQKKDLIRIESLKWSVHFGGCYKCVEVQYLACSWVSTTRQKCSNLSKRLGLMVFGFDKLIWFFITRFSPTNCAAVTVVPGQISLEEFIEGAERDPWVMEQLKLDLGPCKWFREQQQKKKSWLSLCHLPCLDTNPLLVFMLQKDTGCRL